MPRLHDVRAHRLGCFTGCTAEREAQGSPWINLWGFHENDHERRSLCLVATIHQDVLEALAEQFEGRWARPKEE